MERITNKDKQQQQQQQQNLSMKTFAFTSYITRWWWWWWLHLYRLEALCPLRCSSTFQTHLNENKDFQHRHNLLLLISTNMGIRMSETQLMGLCTALVRNNGFTYRCRKRLAGKPGHIFLLKMCHRSTSQPANQPASQSASQSAILRKFVCHRQKYHQFWVSSEAMAAWRVWLHYVYVVTSRSL